VDTPLQNSVGASGGDFAGHAVVMLHNIGVLANILNYIAILMGLGLFLGGMFKLKRYGEMRTFMSHQMTIWAPIAMIFSGVLLLLLPVTITTSLQAFFGSGQTLPLSYHGETTHNIDAYIPVVNGFIRLIGVGAIMRACMLFSKTGQVGGQPGVMAKALMHLFGGILCVHIVGTVDLMKYLFDLQT
jgi:intracellular multiplication protein IcmC